jgi:catechol 2,3-dioxygenase-like lactoylglutathione lyase family enzyme
MQFTFDQVHLGVPDPKGAAEWYRQYLGATPGDHVDRVFFGGTRFIFLKNERPAPSRGAAIDHVALSFRDLDSRLQVVEGSGGRVTEPPTSLDGLYRSAFIEDPWGARIELVDDPEASGVHHVHLQVPDPARTRAWYIEMLGGTAGKLKGRLDGVQCAGVWLLTDEGASSPSRGHTIDHIGWRMPDLMTTAAAYASKGGVFTTPPEPGPAGAHAPVMQSFTEDPWGVKIELLQRRAAD